MRPTRDETLRKLREHLSELREDYGVSRLAVFGSVAADTADDESDIDLIVELDRPIGLRFVDLAERIESILGRKVDLLTPGGVESIRLSHVAESIRKSVIYV